MSLNSFSTKLIFSYYTKQNIKYNYYNFLAQYRYINTGKCSDNISIGIYYSQIDQSMLDKATKDL